MVVVVVFVCEFVNMDVGVEKTYVTYQELAVTDEWHPLYLCCHPVDREQSLALLVIDGQAVYNDVVREEPSHTAKVYTSAYTVLQLRGEEYRNALLYSRRVYE